MTCPECGSEEKLRDSGSIFCKKCGLELDDMVISKKGSGKMKVLDVQNISFKFDPKKELYALKLGLKNKKLSPDWEQQLGFKLNSGYLKPELKDKAHVLINKAFEKNKADIIKSKERLQGEWNKVNNKFFIEMEKLMTKWPSRYYTCYLSMCTRLGFHNSSKNFIIIQHRLDKISNYVIAHELFHILFRHFITGTYKQGYDGKDKALSKIVAAFVLLDHPVIKTCFPQMNFTLSIFTDEYNKLAHKIYPVWKETDDFVDFMNKTYEKLNLEKTFLSRQEIV